MNNTDLITNARELYDTAKSAKERGNALDSAAMSWAKTADAISIQHGRLINAEALKSHYSWLGEDTTLTKKDIDDIVDAQPSVDAVKVIRCRDCVHFGECLVTENDYCSKGERKENEHGEID